MANVPTHRPCALPPPDGAHPEEGPASSAAEEEARLQGLYDNNLTASLPRPFPASRALNRSAWSPSRCRGGRGFCQPGLPRTRSTSECIWPIQLLWGGRREAGGSCRQSCIVHAAWQRCVRPLHRVHCPVCRRRTRPRHVARVAGTLRSSMRAGISLHARRLTALAGEDRV